MKRFTPVLAAMVCLLLLCSQQARAQDKIDSLFSGGDTTAILDSLMKDFDSFLDSLSRSRSFFSVSLGMGTGIFSFEDKGYVSYTPEKKMMFMPGLGYFHKSGFGLSASGYMIYDKNRLNLYECSLTPSFDLIRSKMSTGIAYSHYFDKDSLDFYITPIQNEIYAYFAWKDWWLRPGISASFGWGSKSSYRKQEYKRYSRLLQRTNSYFVTIKNYETIEDVSITLSVRKDFDWFDVLGQNDLISLTPVILLNSGTQNFGFNTSYALNQTPLVRVNSLPSNSDISESTDFALQSLSAVIRGTYMKGKFLFQPQVYFDYVLWDTDQRFNTVYSLLFALNIH